MKALAVLLLMVGACAQVPEPAPVARTLTVATWNLEHLTEESGAGCEPRSDADYLAMRAYVDAINADVIAFQEVENEAAAARVFDPARYQIVIESRQGSGRRTECNDRPGQHLTRQAVGLAVRRDLEITRHADVVALQAGGQDLRSGVDVTVHGAGVEPIRLLAVHLKSGCSEGDTRNDCPRLFEQVPIVEAWMDARAAESVRFAVLGDFNRRLAVAGDRVWVEWDDAEPANADLSLAAGAVGAHCDPRYGQFIDHIVLDRRATAGASGFREWTFGDARLSDHCAISVDLSAAGFSRGGR
ncbi:MAG: endonuclease/exonuclease/phosphatase family protein [Hyphomonadaceae bacterium]